MMAVGIMFLHFLEKNIMVSVVILAVLMARWMLRRFPKKYSYALWSIVGIKMLVDVPVRSALSLFNYLPVGKWLADIWGELAARGGFALVSIPNQTGLTEAGLQAAQIGLTVAGSQAAQTGLTAAGLQAAQIGLTVAGSQAAQTGLTAAGLRAMQTGLAAAGSHAVQTGLVTGTRSVQAGLMAATGPQMAQISSQVQVNLPQTGIMTNFAVMNADSLRSFGIMLGILLVVYVIGVYAVLVMGEISWLQFKKRIQQAVRLKDNIWECDDISTPFVLGLFRPHIYIPFRMDAQSRAYVLRHEQYHIQRFDPWAKLSAYVLLAIYWMNPLVWAAYFLFVQDQEMSCDEAVIQSFGNGSKQGYSDLLLSFATGQSQLVFAPIAFGESDASKRIKNVLNYKKPGAFATLAGVAMVAVIAIVCLTGNVNDGQQGASESTIGMPDGGRQSMAEGVGAEEESAAAGTGTTAAEQAQMEEQVQMAERTQMTERLEIEAKRKKKLEELAVLYEQVDEERKAKLAILAENIRKWEEQTGGIDTWAQAAAFGDMETISELSTEEVQQTIGKHGLIVQEIGENPSSLSKWHPYEIRSIQWHGDGENLGKIGKVQLQYYVMDSEPHIWVWEETLSVKRDWTDENNFTVYDEKMVYYDDIANIKTFRAAYPDGVAFFVMNYAKNGCGEILNRNAITNTARYSALFDPVSAARYLLNLSEDESKVQLTEAVWTHTPVGKETTVVKIYFVRDDKTITIRMDKPWGEDGIWIPQEEL